MNRRVVEAEVQAPSPSLIFCFAYNDAVDNTSTNNDELPLTDGEKQHAYLLLLAGPPVATWVLWSVFWLLVTEGWLGIVGVFFCLLTPVVCALWAFRICRRLTKSWTELLFLTTLELVLIFIAYLLAPKFTMFWLC
jgi:hypothetical protein